MNGSVQMESERRLAALMFTDMVGYTALTQRNEQLAMELLEEQRSLVRKSLANHKGREIDMIGDGFLMEFASALEAVKCAVEIQSSFRRLNASRPEGKADLDPDRNSPGRCNSYRQSSSRRRGQYCIQD